MREMAEGEIGYTGLHGVQDCPGTQGTLTRSGGLSSATGLHNLGRHSCPLHARPWGGMRSAAPLRSSVARCRLHAWRVAKGTVGTLHQRLSRFVVEHRRLDGAAHVRSSNSGTSNQK